MTTTLIAPKWLYIDGKGHALINGKKELNFDLPKQWNLGELEYAFKEACLKYDLEIPEDEGELQRMIREAVKSFGKRNIGKPETEETNTKTLTTSTPQEQAFEIAEYLKTEFDFKTMNDTREVYFYDSGRYVLKGERLIEIECAKISPDVKTSVVNEVIEIIRRTTPVNRDEFDNDIFILNTKNGLLNIKTGEFREHTAEYLSLIQIPISYDKKATCKRIVRFLYNIMSEPSDVPLVLEFIAYCLLRNSRLQKDLMLQGEGDNGKSVLLALIRAFLGTENISSKTLYQLTSNRFATSALFGKLANIFADISARTLHDIEIFKSLGNIDRISAEKKNKDAFDFEPTAKLIFSCNVPPKPSEDMDEPYFRRWILVQVQLRMHDYFDHSEIVRDSNLLEKLTSEEELSGLLNLVIISAKRLFTQWRFCKERSTAETREIYERLADPVKAWMDENCELGKDREAEKEILHANYIEYCWQKKYRRLSLNAFGRALKEYGIYDAQRGTGKTRKHVWTGIALIVDAEGQGKLQ